MHDLLPMTARRALDYLDGLDKRGVTPTPEALARLAELGGPLPDAPSDSAEVIALLDRVGSPATVASTGGRYFGFVVGGALPSALAANWLAAAWDQNAGTAVLSPVSAVVEAITQGWLLDLLALPAESGVGFVTGATMANLSALAAARHAVLKRAGWDVESHGLFGAPPITVVVGDEVHVSVLKALSLLGLGRERIVRVPVDGQGRMRPEALPKLAGPTRKPRRTHRVSTRPTGVVKFFDAKRGFGFIERENATDLFVHVSALEASGLRNLEPGQRVDFDLEQGRRGDEAHRLSVL